jgi:zona occludens toxin
MTAVIHHGPPGSYKTFALVQRVIIPAIKSGRVVVTNVRGVNDISIIEKTMGFVAPASAQILYVEPSTQGYALMARFFHWVPAGALIVMDEGQRVFPTRDKTFSQLDQPDNIPVVDAENNFLLDVNGHQIMRPATLEIAIDQHRHFNWDIYISTPNIAKIHGEIRKCVEWAYRHRDNTGLLPWLKNTWTEFRHDSEQSGKSIAHYSGTPNRYNADPNVFTCYQSTATGTAKNSSENISIFKDKKVIFALFIFICAAAYVVFGIVDAVDRYSSSNVPVDQISVPDVVTIAPQISSVSDSPDIRRGDNSIVTENVNFVNELRGFEFFITGRVNQLSFFTLINEATGRQMSLTSDDLADFGYEINCVSDRFCRLTINNQIIFAVQLPDDATDKRIAPEEHQQAAKSENRSYVSR